ncbi:peptidoglycan-associated lipoprotein Pal [Thalassospiraceae bacterium LMO-SO8]|jgi:peptidoglycan-associated lipoprotein|nr:peptidoglycan-associated lipoprotein Pal [Thalassospiraceae bacterium LMO-SO8]
MGDYMRFKVLGMVAALALAVSACESTSGSGAGASGSGQSITPLPAAAPLALKDQFVVDVGDRVFFAFDRFDVEPDQKKVLDVQAAWLKKYSSVTVTIEGHADERGTREYNLALGERRANAVKEYLIYLGIDAKRIKTVSYGEERPVALGSDETAWSQNRRGVTVVTGPGS